MTWEEVCDDPRLQDLPYKIELNQWGNIEMSPREILPLRVPGADCHLLKTLLPDGSR